MSGPVRIYKLIFFGFYDTLIIRQVLILKYIHKTTWFFIKSFCVKNEHYLLFKVTLSLWVGIDIYTFFFLKA